MAVPVSMAVKAHVGWLNVVAVRMQEPEPVAVVVTRLEPFADQPGEVQFPYHAAGGWKGKVRGPRSPDPQRLIDEGLRVQRQRMIESVKEFHSMLRDRGLDWQRAVRLVGRGWMGHSLDEILDDRAHVVVYEAHALREAAGFALAKLGIDRFDQDEKDVPELVAEALGDPDPDARLRAAKPPQCRHWAKEERLLAMAAWLHGR